MTDEYDQRAFGGPFLVQNFFKHNDRFRMTDAIPDVPAMVGQIYEELEKEKTRCIVF